MIHALRKSRNAWRALFAMPLALALGSCGGSASDRFEVVVIGDPAEPFQKGVRLALAGQLARAATAEGLVAFDEQGRVIPALADRWIVTDDGKSYIFRLRDGTWRDGTELTARTARRALESALKALEGTAFGLDLAGIDDVREMAGRVVEIRLVRPMPHFLQMLAQPELGLVRDGQGGGPMALRRVGEGAVSEAVLTPIRPQDVGLPEISDWDARARPIVLLARSAQDAVARFNEGEADLVLGGTIATFPLTSSVGILRGTIQLDPVSGLFGLRVTRARGFLEEPANREAVSMAIDRDALIAPFGVDGWTPLTRIVDPAVADPVEGEDPGFERWTGATIDDRRQVALARVVRWKAGQEEALPLVLSIYLPPGPGSDMLFGRLAGDMAAIGIQVKRASKSDGADLTLVDSVARYPRPSWYLNRLHCTSGAAACVAEADAVMKEAVGTVDPVARAALRTQAERLLADANVFIPFGSPIRWSLVRGDVDAFRPNGLGWHPLMPLAMRPR